MIEAALPRLSSLLSCAFAAVRSSTVSAPCTIAILPRLSICAAA
jgi:hypothetical protein